MSVRLLTEHHLEFLSLTGGCTCSTESILVKMQHCWKSHVVAQIYFQRGHLGMRGQSAVKHVVKAYVQEIGLV